jgi:hypothetical protein
VTSTRISASRPRRVGRHRLSVRCAGDPSGPCIRKSARQQGACAPGRIRTCGLVLGSCLTVSGVRHAATCGSSGSVVVVVIWSLPRRPRPVGEHRNGALILHPPQKGRRPIVNASEEIRQSQPDTARLRRPIDTPWCNREQHALTQEDAGHPIGCVGNAIDVPRTIMGHGTPAAGGCKGARRRRPLRVGREPEVR